jgi:hypothetical protein
MELPYRLRRDFRRQRAGLCCGLVPTATSNRRATAACASAGSLWSSDRCRCGRQRVSGWRPVEDSIQRHGRSVGSRDCALAPHDATPTVRQPRGSERGEAPSSRRAGPFDRPFLNGPSMESESALGSVLGDLDPALAHSVDDGLRAVVDRQLAQDRAHVVLHRLLADAQRIRDLLVRHALGDVVQDLDLAR